MSQGSENKGGSLLPERWQELRQRLTVPVLAFVFFFGVLYIFRAVMLPFILAVVIVYLMEPMVRGMTGVRLLRRRIPRWGAVVAVYITFFTAVTLFSVAFVPALTMEITKAAEELPRYFNEVRERHLPRWSERIEAVLGYFGDTPDEDVEAVIVQARAVVGEAFAEADRAQDIDVLAAVDTSGGQPLLLIGSERSLATQIRPDGGSGAGGWDASRVAFTLVRDPVSGGMAVLMGENELRVQPADDGSYALRFVAPGTPESSRTRFSLEREIVRGLSTAVESGSAYAGDLLGLIQSLLEFVIGAFVMLILTFMVAAFISIDLPRIMGFVRSLIPQLYSSAYEELLQRLNRGLSGVIRGQLVICSINGVATGVGLWVLDVDFALMLGIIAGVLSLIPIFGTIISTIPAVLMGLVQGFSTALLVLVWILFVHFIDANFLTPKIVGSSSQLHPVVIIFALVAAESGYGIFGALLAVPVASIIQTLFLFLLSRARRGETGEAPSPATMLAVEGPEPPPGSA